MKTAILLGAGSSIPAGFPSTKSLTDRVLSGNGVWRYDNGTYFIDGHQPTDTTSSCVIRLLRYIHGQADKYFMEHVNRYANYEDVYYLVDQMCDEKFGESENPAIDDYKANLFKYMEPLCREAGLKGPLLKESRNYIADVVWGSLCIVDSPDHCKLLEYLKTLEHLKTLKAACESNYVIGISTLCHDTHVETYFKARGISFDDGFSEEESGVRYWNGDFSSEDKIPFLKLHGSVNWFRLRPDRSEPFYDDRIGIPLDGDHEHTKGKNGELQQSLDGRPLLLIGTFNKIPDYTRGIFLDLHHQFRRLLLKSDQLLVCGYSFGDKGINTAIIEWYYTERGRRLLIIHPDSEELVMHARGAIRNKWKKWKKKGGVRLISKKFECVEECELLEYLKR